MKDKIILGLSFDQLLATTALLFTIIGGIWYLGSVVYKRYFVGGFLTVQLIQKNFWSAPQDIVQPVYDSEGFVDKFKSVGRFHLTYRYDLIITNNSDHTAYFPKMVFEGNKNPFVEIDHLNEYEPIQSGLSVTLKAVIHETSDTLPSERKRGNEEALIINNLKLLIVYQNKHKVKFYTLFNAATRSSSKYVFKPKF